MSTTTATERRADDAAVTALLNCYLRETGTEVGEEEPVVRLVLDRPGAELVARLRYRSATGQHAFHLPLRLRRAAGAEPQPVGHAALARLLGEQLGADRAELHRFVEAVTDSTRNVARFLAERPPGAAEAAPTPFLRAEQSLLLGHPLHPTPKSREPMTVEQLRRHAPELAAAFPLRWFRAEPDLLAQDSAWVEPAADLLAGVLATDPEVDPAVARAAAAGDGAFVPVHPVQAERLLARPAVRALLDTGRLADLGPQGAAWYPTSSVRTVYRPDRPFMLKLSLGVRITNSVRVNLRKELARGVEVHRLLDAGLGAELRARFPRFAIVRDPAWATVLAGDGVGESGFEVVLRENPYPAGCGTDATLVAGLCAETGPGGRSRLAGLVRGLAAAGRRPVDAVARDWFRRYLQVALDPLLWLCGGWGVALEAHQQNSIVELEAGWPAGFRYRDNQGYYFKASHADRLRRLLPSLNTASDTVCDDAVADERFGYYLGVNHLLALVAAFGRAGLAEERALLADLTEHLAAAGRSLEAPPPLVRTLLEAERLRCKANLRTRLHDLDELVGPLASQSIYVDVPNPLLAAAPAGRPA